MPSRLKVLLVDDEGEASGTWLVLDYRLPGMDGLPMNVGLGAASPGSALMLRSGAAS